MSQQLGVGSPDSAARNFCCRGIASLCIIASSSFLSRQVQSTVSQIVTDTHPAVRAGCVQLLAQIYQAIGAIGARPVLKTIIEVVMTLIVDPHPTVHFWSLRALANIIETAGLDFTPYITTCSRLLLKLSAADSHDPEGGSTSTSALRGDLPVRQAVGAVVDQLISAAGPSLWEDKWASRAAYAHVQSFLLDDDVRLVVQGGSALQHLLLISPQEIISPHLIRILLSQLFSSNMQVQMSAVNSIYQVVRRDAPTLSKLGGDKLVERLFTILDADPSVDGVKQTILTWLLQTADSNPAGWLIICHRIFSQELASWQAPDADAGAATVEDEEAQSLGSVFADTSAARGYLARWQTRSFALTCVQSLLNHIQESPHIQALPQRRGADVPLRKLYPKIQDLIRLALLSSTSVNLDLKLSGLALLEQIIVVSASGLLIA